MAGLHPAEPPGQGVAVEVASCRPPEDTVYVVPQHGPESPKMRRAEMGTGAGKKTWSHEAEFVPAFQVVWVLPSNAAAAAPLAASKVLEAVRLVALGGPVHVMAV